MAVAVGVKVTVTTTPFDSVDTKDEKLCTDVELVGAFAGGDEVEEDEVIEDLEEVVKVEDELELDDMDDEEVDEEGVVDVVLVVEVVLDDVDVELVEVDVEEEDEVGEVELDTEVEL